jgi:hypothetical protein
LYRKTELRDMTFRFGNCERLLMSPSVRPSERYSVSLLPAAFARGKTASESIGAAVPTELT